jgi:RNA recognition motif-containing protein
MNIFVAKLDYNTEESALRQLFEEYGEVESCKIITDRDTGRSKGFGFVEMPNEEEGQAAINDVNDTDFDGRTIVVKKARPKEDRGGGGGYGGGNRGGW